MNKADTHGFTLPELMLVMMLSALFSLSVIGVVSYPLSLLTTQQQSLHERHYVHTQGLWLAAELQRAVAEGRINWQVKKNCLLYGPAEGVRIQREMIQWRGGERGCEDNYWQSLTDPEQALFNGFFIEKEGTGWRLTITGRSARIPDKHWSWQYYSSTAVNLNE